MSVELEDLLPAAATASDRRVRAPRQLFARLQLLSALLREAPPGEGGRLIWRMDGGVVMALAVTRPLTLGRDGACDLALASGRVSRRHCVVRPGSDGDELEDVGSTNGTFVNGMRVRHRTLRDGDVIELGGFVLVYVR